LTKLSRHKAGIKAKNFGQAFENILLNKASYENLSLIKIPDGCRRVNTPKGLRLIPVNTPFDFVLMQCGYAITFDAKTVDQFTFWYSLIDRKQLFSLNNCAKNSLRSGYLIWFRKPDLISFIHAHHLSKVKTGQSVTPEDGIILGTRNNFRLSPLFDMAEIKSHLINQDNMPTL